MRGARLLTDYSDHERDRKNKINSLFEEEEISDADSEGYGREAEVLSQMNRRRADISCATLTPMKHSFQAVDMFGRPIS